VVWNIVPREAIRISILKPSKPRVPLKFAATVNKF